MKKKTIFMSIFIFINCLFFSNEVLATNYVAEVDSKQYESYEDAWDDALENNSKITMLDDWVISSNLSVNNGKSITVNMNGYMINRNKTSGSGSGQVFLVKENATLVVNGGDTSREHKGIILSSGIFRSDSNGTHIIKGALITGGYNSNGGGAIHIQKNANVTLNYVTVAGNASSGNSGAGGIRVQGEDAKLTLNYSSVLYNKSVGQGGGGIRVEGVDAYIEINNSRIMHNLTSGDNSDAGGIQINNGRVDINNSEISFNSSSRNGGGIYISNGNLVMDSNSLVSYNSSKNSGGAIYVGNNADEVVISGRFTGNNSINNGGAIYVTHGDTIIDDAIFYGNISRSNGGAVYVKDGYFINLNNVIEMSGNTPNNLYLTNIDNIKEVRLSSGSLIGLSISFATSSSETINVGENYVSYFVSDKQEYKLESINGGLYFIDNSVVATPDSYVVNGIKYEMKKGTFSYNGMKNGNLNAKYYYSDGYFYEPANIYNEHLSSMSINFAMSAMTTDLNGREYTDEIAAENAYNLLVDLGFSNIQIHFPYPTFYGINESVISTIGYIIGSKTIIIDGNETTLIAVAVRGAGYGAEWGSNVVLGSGSGEAKGFKDAADQVEAGIEEYITNHDIRANESKYWLTGFSRAAATTNLVSKRLTDEYGSENVYAYCFETPKGGVASLMLKGVDYSNIHNVVSKNDIVIMVGPSEMGFIRYGVDHIVPANKVGSDEYNAQKDKMIAQLSALNKVITYNDYYHEATVEYFMDYITGSGLISEIDGDYDSVEEWLPFFINELQKRSFTNNEDNSEYNRNSKNWKGYRHFYSTYKWYLKVNNGKLVISSLGSQPSDYQTNKEAYVSLTFEEAIAELMGLFYGATDSEKEALTEKLDIDSIKSKLSMFDIWTEVIDEWEHMSLSDKNNWLNKIWNAVDVASIDDEVISSEKKNSIQNALYVVLDVILDFVAEDYEHNDQNAIGTLANNIFNILQNHYHDVVASWVRSYDSYYSLDYKAPPFSPTANIKTGVYKGTTQLKLNSPTDDAKIYYTLDGTTPTNDTESTFEYTGAIELAKVENKITRYVINAVSVYDDLVSPVATFIYYISDENSFIKDITANDIEYGEELDISAKAAFGIVKYYFSTSVDGEFSTVKPSEVGTYYAKAVVEKTEYFDKIETSVVSFNINKKQLDFSDLEWSNTDFVYDGNEKKVELVGDNSYLNLVNIIYQNNVATNAGNYNAIASISLLDEKHYEIIATPTLTCGWAISKHQIDMNSVEWQTETNFTYDRNEKTISLNNISSLENLLDVSYSNNNNTDVGNYRATVSIVYDEVNYELINVNFEYFVDWTITIATNAFIGDIEMEDWDYGETPIIPSISATFGEVIYKYSDSIDGEYVSEVPSNAGVYYLKVYVKGTTNYTGIEQIQEFEIHRAENETTIDIELDNWTFGDISSQPEGESKHGEIVYTYSTSIDGVYTSEIPTNAGVYYVKATVVETANYSGIEVVKQFEIEKKDPSYVLPTNLKAKKGDKLKEIELPENWSFSSPELVLNDVGVVKVKLIYTPDDTQNYNILYDIEVEITVEKNINVIAIVWGIIIGLGLISLPVVYFITKKKVYN